MVVASKFTELFRFALPNQWFSSNLTCLCTMSDVIVSYNFRFVELASTYVSLYTLVRIRQYETETQETCYQNINEGLGPHDVGAGHQRQQAFFLPCILYLYFINDMLISTILYYLLFFSVDKNLKKCRPKMCRMLIFFFSFGQNYKIYKNACRLPPPTMCRPVQTAPTAPP